MSAASFRRSCSITAVNLSPKPRPGTTCLTTASARICPSPTRKSTFVGEPIARGDRVSRNSPPRLRSRTRETSSRPLHCQQTQTSWVIAVRELNLLEGVAVFCHIVVLSVKGSILLLRAAQAEQLMYWLNGGLPTKAPAARGSNRQQSRHNSFRSPSGQYR